MIDVVHMLRQPRPHRFSIERLYDSVRAHLPGDIRVRTWHCRAARGLSPRLRDAWAARSAQGDVNHVTGDAHYLTFFLDRRRTVLTIHDLESLTHTRGLRRFLFWLLWFWLPVRRSGAVVVISEATRTALQRHVRIDPSRVHLIPNPLPGAITPKQDPFGTERPIVLHIGTKANKNLARHIAALGGLPVRMIIIGRLDDPSRALLDASGIDWESRADLSDEALAAAYREADLLLFASTIEGFGLPILEAQSAGIPIVTSNVSSMPEVAGEGALLVDPFDVAAIRNAVRRIIAEPALRNQLVQAGRRNVARFAPEAIAARYAELYRRVATEAKAA